MLSAKMLVRFLWSFLQGFFFINLTSLNTILVHAASDLLALKAVQKLSKTGLRIHKLEIKKCQQYKDSLKRKYEHQNPSHMFFILFL